MQGLIRVLEEKKRKLEAAAPEVASVLGGFLVEELNARVPGAEKHPNATGNLKRALTKTTLPYQKGKMWVVGVGDLSLLGSPNDPAPHGTIDAFLFGYETKEEEEKHPGYEGAKWRAEREADRKAKELAKANRERDKWVLRSMIEQRRDLNAQIDALQGRISANNDRLDAIAAEIVRIRQAHISLTESDQRRIMALEQEKRQLTAQNNAWREGMGPLRNRIDFLQERIDSIREEHK